MTNKHNKTPRNFEEWVMLMIKKYWVYFLSAALINHLIHKYTDLPYLFILIIQAVLVITISLIIHQLKFNKFVRNELPNADFKTPQIHLDSNNKKIAYQNAILTDGLLPYYVKNIHEIDTIQLWMSKKMEKSASSHQRHKVFEVHVDILFKDGTQSRTITQVSRWKPYGGVNYKEISRLLSQICVLRGECIIESAGGIKQ